MFKEKDEKKPSCGICLKKVYRKKNNQLCELKGCGDTFHFKCLWKWKIHCNLQVATCPCCRGPIECKCEDHNPDDLEELFQESRRELRKLRRENKVLAEQNDVLVSDRRSQEQMAMLDSSFLYEVLSRRIITPTAQREH